MHVPSRFNWGGNPSCQLPLPQIISKWSQIPPPFPPRNASQDFPVSLIDCSVVVQRVVPEVRFTGSDWTKSSKQCGICELSWNSQVETTPTMFGAWFSSTRRFLHRSTRPKLPEEPITTRELEIWTSCHGSNLHLSTHACCPSRLETSKSFSEPSNTIQNEETKPMKQCFSYLGADRAFQAALPMHKLCLAFSSMCGSYTLPLQKEPLGLEKQKNYDITMTYHLIKNKKTKKQVGIEKPT